jgi:hypothetical protein
MESVMNCCHGFFAISWSRRLAGVVLTAWGTVLAGWVCTAAPFDVPVQNGSFEAGGPESGPPSGWSLYAGDGNPQSLTVVDRTGGGKALLLVDGDPNAEIGISQEIPIKPGLAYEAAVEVAAQQGEPAPWNVYLQMRFLPSNTYVQTELATETVDGFETKRLLGAAPDDTRSVRLYLYTHRGQTTRILLDNVSLRGGLPPQPEPVQAPPMKAPVYTELKKLYRETPLAAGGQPMAVIVAPAGNTQYQAAAKSIQTTVQRACAVLLPIVDDRSDAAGLPLTRHVIALGNRSTNAAIGGLYDRYYALVDLKYPGPEGYVVRSVHNPFGNGFNAILVGGSDDIGVGRAADTLCKAVATQPAARGELTLGWLMRIQLGKGVTPPTDLREFETWEASDGYGSVGYFGWNSLSKRMAMYAMTGDETQAAEFLRLAFPDEQAIKDIENIDGERIENKDEPLAGAYHYNQHMMILYWDLIEESPFFTDEQRLKITNSLARQLEHDDYARKGVFALTGPAPSVGSRHGQWAAIGLYCLGRYFQTYYPSPLWEHCRNAGTYAFASLHKHAWVYGESDNLFWYSTGIAPIFSYLTLTQDRIPLENGVVPELLRGQEILLSGERGDRQLSSASLGFLHKAAYLTDDGRWIYYRKRTRMNTDIFRLGQSYWPPPALKPVPPTDLCGVWSVQELPRPMWQRRQSGIPLDQSFQFASFRTDVGDNGDFVLLDGFNGASRNPYHTFAVLDLRIAGNTLLRGYHNQVLTKADGMVEPTVAMDAALLDRGTVGSVAFAAGDVPDAAFCDWKRTLVQRLGQYALVLDDLTFRTDSRNMTVETLWQTEGGRWLPDRDVAVFGSSGRDVPESWTVIPALGAACTSHPDTPGMVKEIGSIGIVLLRATEPGSWLDVPFTLDRDLAGDWFLDTVKYLDRGIVRVLIDGQEKARGVNLYAEGVVNDRIPLGDMTLTKGDHVLRLEVSGRAPGVSRCYAAVAALVVRPKDRQEVSAASRRVFSLSPSLMTDASGSGVIHVTWTGEVASGTHRRFFNLLVSQTEQSAGAACLQIGDAGAALRLPDPALAAITGYPGVSADVLVVGAGHLFGRRLAEAGPAADLLRTSAPVTVDWDFATGRLTAEAEDVADLTLAVAPEAAVTLDGNAITNRAGTDLSVRIPAGRHVLAGAVPEAGALAQLNSRLGALVEQGLRERATARERARQANALPQTPELQSLPVASTGTAIADMVEIGPAQTPMLAVAVDTTVKFLALDGSVKHTIETDGPVRVLHWWSDPELVLAGCTDEKLYAIGLDGQVRWTFTSVMDPAVYRAAKTYWFKTAPGHGGIHGLAAGPFYDGKQMCFVGSACTLEILDPQGQLVERRPVFWGPGKILRLLEQKDGSTDLLIARWPNGTDRLSIVNSKTRKLRHGFYGVPAGQSMVGGWSAQNRVDVIPVDVDDDGTTEVVSATNGRWNRVTVFGNDGRPEHNAQFGPGESNRFRSVMRALVTVDLNADGRQDIVTATAEGLVVALNDTCERLWSRRLPSAPCLLAAPERVAPGKPDAVLVGCDDGTLLWLDAAGDVTRTGSIPGRPSHVVRIETRSGTRFAVGSDKGEIRLVAAP